MTFLQKTLGKNYKWWYCFIYNVKLSLAYTTNSFFIIIRDLLPLLISLLIYGSFLKTADFALYFLLGNSFLKIASILWDISWDLRVDIKTGLLASKLMRPSNPLLHYLCISLGANFYSLLVNWLILGSTIFFTGMQIDFSFKLLVAFCLLFLSMLIFYFVEIIIGSLAFWWTQTNTLIETKNNLIPLLAGALVFLETNSVTQTFRFLPFSFAVHHPMQIYLGKYNPREILLVFAGGIFWCFTLYFLAKIVFKAGLKKNESVGL